MSTSTPSSPPSADIQSLLTEFDASGESAAAFARSRGIAVWKLHYALSRRSGKLRRPCGATGSEQPALLAVRVVDAKPPKSPAPLELMLAGGHRLLISADFDADLLRRVLGALAQC